jgi:hypothetical protein
MKGATCLIIARLVTTVTYSSALAAGAMVPQPLTLTPVVSGRARTTAPR